MVRVRLVLVLFGLLSIATETATNADPELQGDSASMLDRIGRPARASAVRGVLAEARRRDPAAMVEVTRILGAAGGLAAVEALEDLLRDPDDRVRIAAMGSVARIRIRRTDLRERLAKIALWKRGEERAAAARALGRVGDGRSLEALLELARDDDAAVRRAVFHSLGLLTGARVPPVHARWVHWWRTTQRRAAETLPAALDALEADPGAPDVSRHQATLVRHAWVDLALVEERLERWFDQSDRALRTRALELVAELRLGDFAASVERASRFDGGSEALAAAARAAREALGIGPEDR